MRKGSYFYKFHVIIIMFVIFCVSNQSLTSQILSPHISSPASATNIDVALMIYSQTHKSAKIMVALNFSFEDLPTSLFEKTD